MTQTPIPGFNVSVPVKLNKITKKINKKQEKTYYYATVPVRLNPDLDVSDTVELLIFVPPGLAASLIGKIFGKHRYNYQVHLRKEAHQLVDYIIQNRLPAVAFGLRLIQKGQRKEEPEPRVYYVPANEEEKAGGGP